jgi:hypothetical protein
MARRPASAGPEAKASRRGGEIVDKLTGARIVTLQNHIAEVLNQTSEDSRVPKKQQAEMLGECCGQACGLLGEWLQGPAESLRPAADTPVKEMIKDRAAFEEFLVAMLGAAQARASRYGMKVNDELIEQARKAIAETVRKKPRLKSQELFAIATGRVGQLHSAVCDLAARLHQGAQGPAIARIARRVLKKVIELLPDLVIGMSAVVLTQAGHDLSVFGHEAIKMVMTNHIAYIAQLSLHLRLSPGGPALG